MSTLRLTLATEPQPEKCGAKLGPRSKTLCELPPDHIVGRNHIPYREHNHTGRDTAGRWRSWSPMLPVKRRR
jgi:hypothetical protein